MPSVPNRAGTHRALAHDYASMSNEQLKAMHAQAAANHTEISKYASRLPHTTEEMKNRGLLK